MRLVTGVVLTIGALVIAPAAADAQIRLGPEVMIADNVDFGLGGRVFIPLASVSPNVEIAPFFDVYFPDFGSYWELGGTLYYMFSLPDNPTIAPKVGAGVTVGRFSVDTGSEIIGSASSTEVGLHLVGGLDFPMDSFTPYVEVGAGIGDIPDFVLRGGLAFNVGGGG